MHAQLHRQLDLAPVARIEADRVNFFLELAQDRVALLVVEFRDLKVGRQRDHQHVDLLVRRADRLRVGAAQREIGGVEIVPHGWIGVGGVVWPVVENRGGAYITERGAGFYWKWGGAPTSGPVGAVPPP